MENQLLFITTGNVEVDEIRERNRIRGTVVFLFSKGMGFQFFCTLVLNKELLNVIFVIWLN